MTAADDVRAAIVEGRTALGIELGSTRIKACLVGEDPSIVLATGSHEWENRLEDGLWSYPLDEVWMGLQAAYASLVDEVERRWLVRPETYGAIGVSAMMHGYLAFDEAGELLVPFRTWRNTNTGAAAEELTALLGTNIPLRWSIAHLHQAILDGEPHVPAIGYLTTLAGFVHWRLTGRRVLGIGDASGVFPIDAAARDYDGELLARFDAHVADHVPGFRLADVLPEILVAGKPAGVLTAEGASLLDPTARLRPGIPMCPPEGDAGTGMVATNAVAARTGNVSVGTSIFATVVLERPLAGVHEEIDLVATPVGDPAAMVHCNNGASELGAWAGLFGRFAEVAGVRIDADVVFGVLLAEALEGEPDAGGIVAYGLVAGEPIAGLVEGRPLVVRSRESRLTLANLMRAQVYAVFGTFSLGMQVLADAGVELDRMVAHGGVFRTAGVAQRLLAGALDAPVAVGERASEGGAWGIAVLAAYLADSSRLDLSAYLDERVFRGATVRTIDPDPADAAGFAAYRDRYRAGLILERAAVDAL